MAKNALAALRAIDDPTADLVEADLVGPGKIIPDWDAPANAAEQTAQRAPLLIGQLKAISAPFYQHLHQKDAAWLAAQRILNGTSHAGSHFPWTLETTDDANKAVANIGQLKAVFSLRFETLEADIDQDGLADEWEILNFGAIAAHSGTADPDGDGLNNLVEFSHGFVPYQADSDGDGYSDRLSIDHEVYLKVDETEGENAADSSGRGRDGLLRSTAAWLPDGGIDNGAIKLNGGTDVVELDATILNGVTDLTISLWFEMSGAAASQTLLSAASPTSSPELAIGIEDGNKIRFDFGGGGPAIWSTGRNLADGLWHHLVITRNATTGAVALHLDGAMLGTPQTLPLGALSVEKFVLGQRHQSLSTYDGASAFNGLLDEIRIYSAVLESPRFVTELFGLNDFDGDGLPDNWEMALSGNLSVLSAAPADFDGDGFSNRQEFEAGTNPNDYYNGEAPVITLFSGSGQTVYNGGRTRDPLVFLVTDGTSPLANVPVSLRHLEFLGHLRPGSGGEYAPSMILRTNSEGKVSVYFKADP